MVRPSMVRQLAILTGWPLMDRLSQRLMSMGPLLMGGTLTSSTEQQLKLWTSTGRLQQEPKLSERLSAGVPRHQPRGSTSMPRRCSTLAPHRTPTPGTGALLHPTSRLGSPRHWRQGSLWADLVYRGSPAPPTPGKAPV